MSDGLGSLIVYGVALGLSFNPVAAMGGSAMGAAFAGAPDGDRGNRMWGWLVLAVAWAAGDGLRALSTVPDLLDSAGWGVAAMTPVEVAVVVASWIVVSAGVGYLAPFLVGCATGRRVHWGTGRLSAAVVALAGAGALYVLAGTVRDLIT